MVFGQKGHMIHGFWATLSLRVRYLKPLGSEESWELIPTPKGNSSSKDHGAATLVQEGSIPLNSKSYLITYVKPQTWYDLYIRKYLYMCIYICT